MNIQVQEYSIASSMKQFLLKQKNKFVVTIQGGPQSPRKMLKIQFLEKTVTKTLQRIKVVKISGCYPGAP